MNKNGDPPRGPRVNLSSHESIKGKENLKKKKILVYKKYCTFVILSFFPWETLDTPMGPLLVLLLSEKTSNQYLHPGFL